MTQRATAHPSTSAPFHEGITSGLGVATSLVGAFDWPMLVRVDVIWQAVAISCTVGVVFGLWPAWKASRLHPISALRFA